jgi:hypothetical protein
MGITLPIDRARESKFDPLELEAERQKFAEKEARLRRKAQEHDDAKADAEREGGEEEDAA